MVTYEAMTMMFQFGMFLVATATAIVAIIALYTKRKK
ncbi:putative holin-like toxin [Sporosarcina oncorhynchi]|uniref:Holin-like toxin n=1 Tax=Sporosarcina oncorhynchi TaxID=3056444 RepID=A0ABZ0L332_9BACL|nr:putative holin-like toxin [Sporosarcina sp. T2O-4]WOV86523.1 putative holin-like toxin [Sporosarcina sp. T2O-4]